MFTTPFDFLMKISENDNRIRIRIRVIKSDPDPVKIFRIRNTGFED